MSHSLEGAPKAPRLKLKVTYEIQIGKWRKSEVEPVRNFIDRLVMLAMWGRVAYNRKAYLVRLLCVHEDDYVELT